MAQENMQKSPAAQTPQTPYLYEPRKEDETVAIRRSDVVKHPEMIQGVVNRLASSLFFVKGWTVTLVAALFALAAKDTEGRFTWIALLPAIAFWILDGFFLHQERRFRKLYDHVRTASEDDLRKLTPFSMNADKARGIEQAKSWPAAIFSPTLLIFYGVVLAIVIGGMLYFAQIQPDAAPSTQAPQQTQEGT